MNGLMAMIATVLGLSPIYLGDCHEGALGVTKCSYRAHATDEFSQEVRREIGKALLLGPWAETLDADNSTMVALAGERSVGINLTAVGLGFVVSAPNGLFVNTTIDISRQPFAALTVISNTQVIDSRMIGK